MEAGAVGNDSSAAATSGPGDALRQAVPLTTDVALVSVLAMRARSLAAILDTLDEQIAGYEQAIAELWADRADARPAGASSQAISRPSADGADEHDAIGGSAAWKPKRK